jgi:hypothetical protein
VTDRRVRQTGKDRGDITSLCNGSEVWSPRQKADAISDIEGGLHRYYVREEGDGAWVKVVDGPTGKYLRTEADSSSKNNLDNLPDC